MWAWGASKKKAWQSTWQSIHIADHVWSEVLRQGAEREEAATASSTANCQHLNCEFFNSSTENKHGSSKPISQQYDYTLHPYSLQTNDLATQNYCKSKIFSFHLDLKH